MYATPYGSMPEAIAESGRAADQCRGGTMRSTEITPESVKRSLRDPSTACPNATNYTVRGDHHGRADLESPQALQAHIASSRGDARRRPAARLRAGAELRDRITRPSARSTSACTEGDGAVSCVKLRSYLRRARVALVALSKLIAFLNPPRRGRAGRSRSGPGGDADVDGAGAGAGGPRPPRRDVVLGA